MKFYSNEENGITLSVNEFRISYNFGQFCYFKVDKIIKWIMSKNKTASTVVEQLTHYPEV